jgi:hypothetical protein
MTSTEFFETIFDWDKPLSEEQLLELYGDEPYRPCNDYFVATITKDGEDVLTYVGDTPDNWQEMYEDLALDRTYKSYRGYYYQKFLSDAYFLEQVNADYNIALERIRLARLVEEYMNEVQNDSDGEVQKDCASST